MRLQDLQQNMAQEVLELSCEIARQVVRQELRSNPTPSPRWCRKRWVCWWKMGGL